MYRVAGVVIRLRRPRQLCTAFATTRASEREHARAPRHGGSCKQATDGQTGSRRYTLTLNYIIVSPTYTQPSQLAVTTRTPTTTATTTPTTTTIRTTTKYTATYPWYDYDRAAAGKASH